MKKKIIIVCSCCLIVIGILYSIRLIKEKNRENVGVMEDTVYADTLSDGFFSENEGTLFQGGASEKDESDALKEQPADGQSESEAEENELLQTKKVLVYVCGKVINPGVYSVSPEARIIDAVTAAGGLTDEAREGIVNLAASVYDGMEIYIPGDDGEMIEVTDPVALGGLMTGNPGKSGKDDGRININTAGSDELTQLSGIGDSRAADIIAYRESAGGFLAVEDIMKVPGIKDGIFNRIKDRIKCE